MWFFSLNIHILTSCSQVFGLGHSSRHWPEYLLAIVDNKSIEVSSDEK